MVHQRDALSNLTAPVERLFQMLRDGFMEMIMRSEPRVPVIDHRQQYRMKPADIERLVTRYNETKNMRQVAREFGISRTTVKSHLALLGVKVRSSKPMSDAQKKMAREMWAAGMTSTQIGKKLGFSHHTILRTVR